MRELRSIGALDIERRFDKSGRRTTNLYRIRVAAPGHRATAQKPSRTGASRMGAARDSRRGAARDSRTVAADDRRTVAADDSRTDAAGRTNNKKNKTNHEDDESIGLAEQLLEQLVADYPTHNNGALLTVAKADAVRILAQLLESGRSPERIRAMAEKLWTCTEADRGCGWIVTKTDRSLEVLWRARDTLDHLVSRSAMSTRSTPAPCLYRHTPPCSSVFACTELERQIVAQRDREEAAS
jgi:hypothetical protein